MLLNILTFRNMQVYPDYVFLLLCTIINREGKQVYLYRAVFNGVNPDSCRNFLLTKCPTRYNLGRFILSYNLKGFSSSWWKRCGDWGWLCRWVGAYHTAFLLHSFLLLMIKNLLHFPLFSSLPSCSSKSLLPEGSATSQNSATIWGCWACGRHFTFKPQWGVCVGCVCMCALMYT